MAAAGTGYVAVGSDFVAALDAFLVLELFLAGLGFVGQLSFRAFRFLGFFGVGGRLALLGLPLLLLLTLRLLPLSFGFLGFLGARAGLALLFFIGLFGGGFAVPFRLGPLLLLLAFLLGEVAGAGGASRRNLSLAGPADFSHFGRAQLGFIGRFGRGLLLLRQGAGCRA